VRLVGYLKIKISFGPTGNVRVRTDLISKFSVKVPYPFWSILWNVL